MTYDEIVKVIVEKSGILKEEIDKRVENKLEQLSGLISKEGAAHIIANEMKVKVFEDFIKKLKINRVVAGMGSVDLVGKVVKLYGVREFKTDRREGKVANFLIGDDTGVIRIVLWDLNHIKEIEDGKLIEDINIKIENGYVKDNNGFPEVHLGGKGVLKVGVEVDFGEVKMFTSKKLMKINELNESDNADIAGTIVQIFEPRTYESCSECRRKVNLDGGDYVCNVHGKVSKKDAKILNFYLDDGSGNLRVVAFGEVGESILKSENFEEIKNDLLGMQFKINGRVVKNLVGDRLEFNANSISELNPKEIVTELIKQVEV